MHRNVISNKPLLSLQQRTTKNLMLCFLTSRFINARRRIVQPMIDQSNRAGKFLDTIVGEPERGLSRTGFAINGYRHSIESKSVQNRKKLVPVQTPAAATAARVESFPYTAKGKSIRCSFRFEI
jgi:hypothetical protein